MTVFDVLTLIFGLSLFLFGMNLMGDTLKKSAGRKLKVILGLDAKVMLESPNTLQRFEGKAKRVKDLRGN